MTTPPTSNRREFLSGKSAAQAVENLIAPASEPGVARDATSATAASSAGGVSDSPAATVETYLLQLSRPAMACRFEVLLNAGQYPDGAEAALNAMDLVELLEEQLSVYREQSEVMQINRAAEMGPVAVEPRLFELLVRASEWSQATSGAFDITTGPLIKAWGFYRRAGAIPSACTVESALASVGSQHLELDAALQTIRFTRSGMELNLGAVGKGFALDRAGEAMQSAGIGDFLLHGGQSSVLARGSHAGFAPGGWSIGIGHPLQPDRRLAEVYVRDRALATSGATHQFFRHGGKRYGHILDPRTGWPAEGVLSATVLAETAAEADALSTAFYALGAAGAKDYCQAHPGVAALIVHAAPGSSSVEVAAWGLAETDWRLFA